jgi:hypothetical protein
MPLGVHLPRAELTPKKKDRRNLLFSLGTVVVSETVVLTVLVNLNFTSPFLFFEGGEPGGHIRIAGHSPVTSGRQAHRTDFWTVGGATALKLL